MGTEKNVIIEKPKDTCRSCPLVFDSPHSGITIPASFHHNVSLDQIKTSWDAYVDELWAGAVHRGATLIAADFPRAFIDPNRARDDIDPVLLEDGSKLFTQPTKYSERGMGLIRRYILPGVPLYNGPLSDDQVKSRINDYYDPYHNALAAVLDDAFQSYGAVWHIDCHSMKSTGNAMNIDSGVARPDFVIGDLDGQSASPAFRDVIVKFLTDKGYSVNVNDPYKGGYCVAKYGQPTQQRNSIQIEINRALYMDEAAFQKIDNFYRLQQDLMHLVDAIIVHIQDVLGG